LIEKPPTSNVTEASILYNLPELSQPNALVVLEAFYNHFHPTVHLFRSFINPADVVYVYIDSMVLWLMVSKDNIGLNYNLPSGSMMMLGGYNFNILRLIFDDELEEYLTCDTNVYSDGVHDKCDYNFKVKFRFPNSGIGEAISTL
jgi:predicted dehydrogenase